MVQVDSRPPGLNVLFRPGATLTVELTWPAGSLAGRTFSSTLSGAALGLSITGDVMTITATVAQTAAATQPADWLLIETIAGVDEPIMIGEWHPSDDAGTATRTVTVTQGAVAVAVTVLAGAAVQAVTPNLRASLPVWTENVWSTDAGVLDATALVYEHGNIVIRGSGSGTGVRSNRRSGFMVPGSPGGYSRIRSRWFGKAYTGTSGLTPQRGHMHGVGIQADGKRRAVVCWHDIVFSAPWVFNLGIWEANTNGTSFALVSNVTVNDQVAASAGSRAANVVTLTVPTGHGFGADDVVAVDMSDNSYDGTFVLSSVTATTVVYPQTAADDASAGTGTVQLVQSNPTKGSLVRTTSATDAARASGVVTATVTVNHPFQVGDWLEATFADTTYNGTFRIIELPSSTQVRWRQSAADDASAGAGTISKTFPYWVESEWSPGLLRARIWPEVGMPGSGPLPAGTPGWESAWGTSANLTGAGTSQPDPARGVGCAVLGAHLSSLPTELRYDSLTCESWPSS